MKKLLIFIPVMIAVCIFTGCEGRTMSNMTPTGDTVEVEIEARADSMATGMGI